MKMKQTFTFPLALACCVTIFMGPVSCHQHMTKPTPISYMFACRIGDKINCPGPCPNRLFRPGQKGTKPSTTVRRGDLLPVHIAKNNHAGGFNRWSLVRVEDINNRIAHEKGAFLWSCADSNVTHCNQNNRKRNCRVDKNNEFYKKRIRIPTIYPDGNYVLGWAWYGGANRFAEKGAFGDYYDCAYLRIEGGTNETKWRKKFDPAGSLFGKHGLCRATTNQLGVCWRQKCPGGVRKTKLMKPIEFVRRQPGWLYRSKLGLKG